MAVTIERMSPRAATKTDSKLAARLAALASLGAAVIHFAVVPTHWQEWPAAGVFFVSIAVFQLIWAFAALGRATTEVLVAGVLLNVGAVALWLVSRTAGAPFGPHAGMPERVQAADLCALLLQIYVVMGAGWVLYRGHFGQQIPALANALILLGAVGVVTLASTVGVASGLRHGHHTPAGAEVPHPSAEHAEAHSHHRPEPPAAPPSDTAPLGTIPQAPAPVDTPPAHDEHGEHAH
ncbi:hypothetical protein A6B34_03830 [Mycolicibacterium monacense]|uniref:Transmembrane protein n=1 Tax=Mycolicibacterium monacense TaxID=85693 RepID=A0AAD1N1V5_MYCMB|nr:hypothetical protein [Mycolicibacterium monacense DSM 44395]OBB58936.1 hypothetical protein A6B34_03830 [Mycolicibacterium monacense]ORB21075.1 hypothetical protein BST34_10515 [Mycolicibacterium monacense DSM 44395]QHP88998.1 hypothetical protein EWR22_28600 [Mycolicibacterium monacense DSM 44395]BBZ63532.1 hypothetical protein MMON_48330 [Mycolicibacterium monacense]